MFEKLVKVGVVGVDSGQVIICDPCYIESEWRKADKDESVVPPRIYRDKQTGRTYCCRFDNIGVNAVDVVFDNFECQLADYKGKTPNQCNAEGLWERVPQDPKSDKSGEFSYPGVCHTTLGPKQFGQLRYIHGHAGAGVASSTNLGDGCYPVFAELDSEGRPKRLIIDFQVNDYNNDMDAEEYAEIRRRGYQCEEEDEG